MGPAPILAQRRLQTPHEFEKNLDYWAEINTYSPKKKTKKKTSTTTTTTTAKTTTTMTSTTTEKKKKKYQKWYTIDAPGAILPILIILKILKKFRILKLWRIL